MRKKILFSIMGLVLLSSVAFAAWDSTKPDQADTVAQGMSDILDNFKAIDGTSGSLSNLVISASGSDIAADLTQTGTGIGVKITQADGDTGDSIEINNADTGGGVCIDINQTAGSGNVIDIVNAGTGIGVSIKQDGNATALDIDQNSTGVSLNIDSSAGTAASIVVNNSNNQPHMRFTGDPTVSSPTDGDLWYTGSALSFRDGSTTRDLYGGSAGGDLTGTYPNPTVNSPIKNAGNYYEPDNTCVLALAGYNADPATATTFKDSSVYGNDFDIVGAFPEAVGIVSRTAMDLESGPDYIRQVAASADLGDCDNITLEFWIKTDNAAQGEQKTLFDNRGGGTWLITIGNGTGLITAVLEVASGAASVIATTGVTDTGKWYYTVLTYGITASTLTIYVDGISEDTDSSKSEDVDPAQNDDFSIGANQDGSADFNGKLDGIRILRRLMGATEILARYNAFK